MENVSCPNSAFPISFGLWLRRHCHNKGLASTHQTQDIDPVLDLCWPTVYDTGQTLAQHWVNESCLQSPRFATDAALHLSVRKVIRAGGRPKSVPSPGVVRLSALDGVRRGVLLSPAFFVLYVSTRDHPRLMEHSACRRLVIRVHHPRPADPDAGSWYKSQAPDWTRSRYRPITRSRYRSTYTDRTWSGSCLRHGVVPLQSSLRITAIRQPHRSIITGELRNISFPRIWKGVCATLQSGTYTLSYPRGQYRPRSTVVSRGEKHARKSRKWNIPDETASTDTPLRSRNSGYLPGNVS